MRGYETEEKRKQGRKGSLVVLEASGVGLGALASAALVAAGVALALALEATPHPHLRVCEPDERVNRALIRNERELTNLPVMKRQVTPGQLG